MSPSCDKAYLSRLTVTFKTFRIQEVTVKLFWGKEVGFCLGQSLAWATVEPAMVSVRLEPRRQTVECKLGVILVDETRTIKLPHGLCSEFEIFQFAIATQELKNIK